MARRRASSTFTPARSAPWAFWRPSRARPTEEFVWKAPFTLEAKSCGESGANWNPFTRKVTLCYEMAAELADVYKQYGKMPKAVASKKTR